MIDKLAGLWGKSKLLFFLLIPITLAAVAIKMFLAYNMYKAEKDLKNTQKKDDVLKKQQDEFNKKANEHKTNADKIEKDIEKRNKNKELDLDWHKKK